MPEEVARDLKGDTPPVLLDVRERHELALARIDGAVHIPLGQLAARAEAELDADASVVVFCHHGVRSLAGAALLMQLGFTDVASMRGGIEYWAVSVDRSVGRY
ncbi:MAG: sulfurtransferase [Alphaproteobacteria bacterium]|nr:sulfurtransferase [Alphaproteobacteria bacterium]